MMFAPTRGTDHRLIEFLSHVLYEGWRAYTRAQGDNSHPPWEQTPVWQREGVFNTVISKFSFDKITNYASTFKRQQKWITKREYLSPNLSLSKEQQKEKTLVFDHLSKGLKELITEMGRGERVEDEERKEWEEGIMRLTSDEVRFLQGLIVKHCDLPPVLEAVLNLKHYEVNNLYETVLSLVNKFAGFMKERETMNNQKENFEPISGNAQVYDKETSFLGLNAQVYDSGVCGDAKTPEKK